MVLITVYIPRWYTCDCGAYVIGSDVLPGSSWLTWLTTPTTIRVSARGPVPSRTCWPMAAASVVHRRRASTSSTIATAGDDDRSSVEKSRPRNRVIPIVSK